MIFFYTRYEHVLGEKRIQATLKKTEISESFNLLIITPAVEFLGLPIGGGLVKMSRLYRDNGELIHARHYSQEIKDEVRALKAISPIPYLKLWKGYLILIGITLIGSVLYGIKMNYDNGKYNDQAQQMTDNLRNVKAGQLYGVSFFTDADGNSINGLPGGWIRVENVVGDTLYVKRSAQVFTESALFDMNDLAAIKPKTEADWNPKVEKLNLQSLRDQLKEDGKKRYDVSYIGDDQSVYSGVIMTIKGTE